MRVLLCVYDCCPDAGSEPGTGWQFAQLAARHHEVWALTKASKRDAILAHPDSAAINWCFIEVPERLGPLRTGSSWGDVVHILRWFRPALERARELHATVGFDLAHYVTFGAYWIPHPFGQLGVPLVFGPLTGADPPDPVLARSAGLRFRATAAGRDVLRRALMRTPRWQRFATDPRTVVVTTTEATAEAVLRAGAHAVVRHRPSFALSRAQVATVAAYPTAEQTGGPLRFSCTGRLVGWKGHAFAIRAMPLVLAHHPDAQLHVLGRGPRRRRLDALAASVGVAEHVVFHDGLDRDAERRRIADSHVFVLPSVRDAGSTIMVHAMAMGRPIAAFNTGAVGRVVGDAALLAHPKRPRDAVAALAAVMIRLGDDAELRHRLGCRGRKRVAELFDRELLLGDLEAWYRRAVDG
ncbi:MAG: glycosyltransferase family 4 protein [Acidimicrobiia bacterium]